MNYKRPNTILLSIILTLGLFCVGAVANEPICPDGKDLFEADKHGSYCKESDKVDSGLGQPLHLFDIRKNKNEENVLVIFTRATNDCKFPQMEKPQDLVDLYWRMSEGKSNQCRKESAAKGIIKNQIQVQSVSSDRQHMTIFLSDLDKVKNDIENKTVEVSLQKDKNGKCDAKATFTSGKSDGQKEVSLTCVYGEPTRLFGMNAVTLYGKTDSGEEFKKRYAN